MEFNPITKIITIILLIVVLAGFLVYYFIFNKTDKYVVKNNYYGFKLETPKDWFAEENTLYSESEIKKIMDKCKTSSTAEPSFYQIGAFRFKDQKYPANFGQKGYFPENSPTGAILELSISCAAGYTGNKSASYGYGNLQIGGVKAAQEFLNLSGYGKTQYLSFFKGNILYKISEYVYVSSADKKENDASIRDNYSQTFNKIVGSFKFLN